MNKFALMALVVGVLGSNFSVEASNRKLGLAIVVLSRQTLMNKLDGLSCRGTGDCVGVIDIEDLADVLGRCSCSGYPQPMPQVQVVCNDLQALRDFVRVECRKQGAQPATSLVMAFNEPGMSFEWDEDEEYYTVFCGNLAITMPAHVVDIIHRP